jgi:DNA-binding CsgD family transcriptional regulator
MLKLELDLRTVATAIESHSRELGEHRQKIDEQSAKLVHLEDIVASVKPVPVPSAIMPTSPLVAPAQAFGPPARTNISRFSEQEKRILAVFFHNPDMALSYVDIGRALGRSPNTIKNQVHQIGIKADLFDKAVDSESRNRFRLKDGLKVEQYLNLP